MFPSAQTAYTKVNEGKKWDVSNRLRADSTHLLANIRNGRAKQLDENWNSTRFDDSVGLLRRSGSNVGQSPGGFELKEKMIESK